MSSTRVGQLVVACGCAFTLLTLVGTAHADLIDEVSTLVDAFGRSDGLARRLPPQFVVAAEVRRIAVDDARDDGRRCMTLVALAERSLSFTLRAVARAAAPSPARWRQLRWTSRSSFLGPSFGSFGDHLGIIFEFDPIISVGRLVKQKNTVNDNKPIENTNKGVCR